NTGFSGGLPVSQGRSISASSGRIGCIASLPFFVFSPRQVIVGGSQSRLNDSGVRESISRTLNPVPSAVAYITALSGPVILARVRSVVVFAIRATASSEVNARRVSVSLTSGSSMWTRASSLTLQSRQSQREND